MGRIPVPEEYAGRSLIGVAGRNDYHYGSADVSLDDRKHARSLAVREGEDGHYVGTNDDAVVAAVRELFGTAAEAESGASDGTAEETTSGSESDGEDDTATDGGTCEVVLTSGDREGEVCGQDLPCQYHNDEED